MRNYTDFRLRGILFAAVLSLLPAGISYTQNISKFGAEALAQTARPIHPGVPGKTPFWNQYAHQFIYAPAFDYKEVSGASSYHFVIGSLANGTTYTFEAAEPWAPLSPVWTKVPVGPFALKVTGVSKDGKVLGLAGEGRYYRAPWFNGPYHQPPVMSYGQSARIALDHVLNEDYVQYWVAHKRPDPNYILYRYPSKIWGALIVGAVTQAHLKAGTPEAIKDTELARIIADHLIEVSYKPGTPLEYLPPTYLGYEAVFNQERNRLRTDSHLTISAIDAGTAFLDLYDLTHAAKYLQAGERIAHTLVKNQLPNGSWYQFTVAATGKPTYPPFAIPTSIITYFDRLMTQYKISGLRASRDKALKWMMENPLKTFDWQGQFEDAIARPPYRNQSREQACDMAVYLLHHKKDNPGNVALAEDLIRYAEDQFVIWEQPDAVPTGREEKTPGFLAKNWITPSAEEQYGFWMPVSRTAAIMMDTYRVAYQVTGKEIYLAKAKSFANTFTLVQKENNGSYPTFFTKFPMKVWLNNAVYPAKFMMQMEQSLGK